ncbi:MAG: oligosaccharide flippase family protein [Proteobacteria bacterium]|nr:oligosaccharide flippase family protein [Pseudomonadota bacterium]
MSTDQRKSGFNPDDRARVSLAVVITLFGKLLEMSQGLSVLLALHLFGAVVFGLFGIAYSVAEILIRFLLGGFGDAVVFFAARYAGQPDLKEDKEQRRQREGALYRSLATCIWVPLALSLVIVAALHLGSRAIYDCFFAAQQPPELISLVITMSWILPLAVLVRLPAEATKAYLDMRWAVFISDGLIPAATLAAIPVMWLLDYGAMGLVYAFLIPYGLALPLAWYGFSRHFRLGPTLAAVMRCQVHLPVLGFAAPQSLNMMCNFGLVRIDSLMLAVWYPPERVAIYIAVSDLFRAIRAAQTSFATVFAPLVSRYQARANRVGLSEALDSIARASAALSIPIALVLLAFYSDLIAGPGKPWTESRYFTWLLALSPLLSCFYGFAGNLLLMTGHPRLLLGNSSLLVAVNIALNALLIPDHGLVGAALATATSSAMLAAVQVWQMMVLEGIRFAAGLHRRTIISALMPTMAVAVLSLPGVTELLYGHGLILGLAIKIALVFFCVAVYGASMLAWPAPNPFRTWLDERRRRRGR